MMIKKSVVGFVLSILVVAMGLSLTRGTNSAPEPQKQNAKQQKPKPSKAHSIPGGRPIDTAMAVNNPDEFAWQLFFGLNRQALPGKAGVPDPACPTIRKYDADRPVVWETWALASGGRAGPVYISPNESEVFKDLGAKPVPWDKLPRQKVQPKVLEPLTGKGLDFILKVGRAPGKFDPVEDGGEGGLEVRMNRATYDYVSEANL